MNKKTFAVVFPMLLLMVGCSSFSESEPPKPVATPVSSKKPLPQRPPAKKPAPPVARKAVPGTATYAIEPATSNFKVEPNMPSIQVQPLMPPVETPAVNGLTPAPVPVAVTAPTYTVEDARLPSGTSPAVVALMSEADRNRNSGDLDAAVVVTERALRIDSRNPTLTYKLAQLRIKQNKPQLAEELAGKAALLAGSDLELKRKSWLLIAEARQMQQNPQGAKEAKAKAESFFGR